ncbi:MAG: hypothetical protein K6F70_02995 [Eggerthellaceae bacterium]|nr:hypothetical protein [Eggerthellaceae bacterium]
MEERVQAELCELTDEEKLDELEFAVTRQSLHREICYKTLAFCQTRHMLREVETYIMGLPQYAQAVQSPYHLTALLAKHYGLERILLDEEGNVVTPADLEGLSEDEADDLVADEAYETTEVGRRFVALHDPLSRMRELLEEEPLRAATYRELLAYCSSQKRTYNDLSDLLEGRDVLFITQDGSKQRIQPSVLVDRLNRVGALVWQAGWETTDEGRRFLAEVQ